MMRVHSNNPPHRVMPTVLAVLSAVSLATTATAATRTTTRAKPKRTTTTRARTTTTRAATTTIPPAPSTAAIATAAPTTQAAPAAPTACRTARIMPLGDSLTAFPDSYRGPLFRRLVADGIDVDFVGSLSWAPTGGGDPDGEGHGGFTIGPDASVDFQGKPANLADNLVAWIPAARPDVILLTIGANDLASGGNVPAQAPTKLRNLVGRLQTLAPNAVIAVGDVPPARYDTTGNGIVKPLNDTARALGEASSSDRVIYVPTFRRLLDAGFRVDTDTVDGQHFTAAGGKKFADAWYPSAIDALNLAGLRC